MFSFHQTPIVYHSWKERGLLGENLTLWTRSSHDGRERGFLLFARAVGRTDTCNYNVGIDFWNHLSFFLVVMFIVSPASSSQLALGELNDLRTNFWNGSLVQSTFARIPFFVCCCFAPAGNDLPLVNYTIDLAFRIYAVLFSPSPSKKPLCNIFALGIFNLCRISLSLHWFPQRPSTEPSDHQDQNSFTGLKILSRNI